jgi:hypothetical protein
MKFAKVGAGWTKTSKQGTSYILIKLDPIARTLSDEDLAKVYMFPNRYSTPAGAPQYVLQAPIAEDTVPAVKTATKKAVTPVPTVQPAPAAQSKTALGALYRNGVGETLPWEEDGAKRTQK